MRPRTIATVFLLSLLVVPVAASHPIGHEAALTTRCNPAYESCDPGKLRAGAYTTRYFLPGMRVTVPGSGWISHQDSTTEFKLSPPGYADNDSAPVIRFWIDPRLTTTCSDKVLPLRIATPADAVHWLTTDKNFTASSARRTTIAGHSALTVDYEVSPRAPKCDPSCPASCIDYFAFFGGPGPDAGDLAPGHTPGIKDGFGTGAGDPIRIYFAQIGPPSHLFVVGVETTNGRGLRPLRAAATRMLARLRLPKRLPPKHQ